MNLAAGIPSAAAQHLERAAEKIDLVALSVLDIGCGAGDFLRLLLSRGADAYGLEVEPDTVARAIKAGTDPSRVVLGDGRTLPFADAEFDLVTFVYSFHHVPASQSLFLLAEVARVLRPGGHILAFEPRAYGEMTEVIRPLEDETEVRNAAQALLANPPPPFAIRSLEEYDVMRTHADADTLIRGLVAVDGARALRAADPEIRGEVKRRFLANGRVVAQGRLLMQPTALYVLERT